jgi:hypothetical protein
MRRPFTDKRRSGDKILNISLEFPEIGIYTYIKRLQLRTPRTGD